MPRFFFHVYDHEAIIDHLGTELANVAAAQIHASCLAARLIAKSPEKVWIGGKWFMEATDSNGFLFFRLDLTASPVRSLSS